MKMKPKKIMLVKYINAECIIEEFPTFKAAVLYVYNNSGVSKKRKLGIDLRKRIHGQIRDAIRNKENYCGGQWIEVCNK